MRQLVRSMLIGSMTLVSSSSLLAATFEVPRAFEIMYVDQQAANKFGNDFKVELPAGDHQLVVRFNKLLRQGGDTHRFRSEPIVLQANFAKDASIQLQAPYIASKDKAQAYALAPEFDLMDTNHQRSIRFQQQLLPTQPGFQNTRNYLAEIAQLSQQELPSSLSVQPVAQGSLDDISLEMLKFWYNKASLASREAVQLWRTSPQQQMAETDIAAEMLNFWALKASAQQTQAFLAWTLK